MMTLKLNTISLMLFVLIFCIVRCKDPETEKKIDANLKAELIRLKNTSQLEQRITILFKVNEELTELHHAVLKKNGVEIGANIGHIYTGTIPAKSVYKFAKMRFVDYVQGKKILKAHPADSTSM